LLTDGLSRRSFLQATAAAVMTLHPSPRRPKRRTRSVSWSGYSWTVRPASWDGPPGPNRWSARNVAVDDGILRLGIDRTRRGWTCAEIQSRRSFGYGRYEFVVNSNLARLDPWVVLGLFTYSDDLPRPHNEIDIEVAKWGRRRDRFNAQLVEQPYRARGNTKRVTLPPRPPYTMWWDWTPGSIAWGITDESGALVRAHSKPTQLVPAGELVHLNLWLAEGHAPARPLAIEIASFGHTAL
jgi:beta-glucanase (GH16 family)